MSLRDVFSEHAGQALETWLFGVAFFSETALFFGDATFFATAFFFFGATFLRGFFIGLAEAVCLTDVLFRVLALRVVVMMNGGETACGGSGRGFSTICATMADSAIACILLSTLKRIFMMTFLTSTST